MQKYLCMLSVAVLNSALRVSYVFANFVFATNFVCNTHKTLQVGKDFISYELFLKSSG